MNDKHCDYKAILINGLVAIVILSTMIFGSWYIMLNQAVGVVREIKTTSYIVELDTTDTIKRTDSLAMFFNRMDSIRRDVSQLQNDYHDNIDLMINKANGWMAFWIGVVTVILGILSILQIFRQIRATEKLKEQEEKIDSVQKELMKTINKSICDLQEKYAYLEEEKEDLLCTIHENRIAASMICISIPDPLVASSSTDRRQAFGTQLKQISNEFERYLKSVISRKNNDGFDNLTSTLMNMKIALVRARSAFSDHDIHVNFFQLINKIDKAIRDFQKLSVFIREEDVELLKDISKDFRDIAARIR
jgi:hypothetical protein